MDNIIDIIFKLSLCLFFIITTYHIIKMEDHLADISSWQQDEDDV